MPLSIDEAVCIRVWDWSETSQTVSLFTRLHGVIRCVAKGSKRDNARFSGGLELLTRAEFSASIKKADALSILASWDLLETFPAARRRLSSFYTGAVMLDIIQHAVHDHDPHEHLYTALLTALRALGSDLENLALLHLLWAALHETGHRPEVAHDVISAAPLADAPTYAFSPHQGGLTLDQPSAARHGPAWRVRAATVTLLRQLASNTSQPPTDPDAVERATRLLAMYFREALGVAPATFPRLLGE